MTPQVSDFIPGSLEDRENYIEVTNGHCITANKKGQFKIKMCDDNGNPFIATLHNKLLKPDLCDGGFSIITLMNLGYTCLFNKDFCTVYLMNNKENEVTVPHSAQRKHAFLLKTKENTK